MLIFAPLALLIRSNCYMCGFVWNIENKMNKNTFAVWREREAIQPWGSAKQDRFHYYFIRKFNISKSDVSVIKMLFFYIVSNALRSRNKI